MMISSRMINPEVLRPLVMILGEDARALRAKLTALRNTATKGLKSYGVTLQQVPALHYKNTAGVGHVSYTLCAIGAQTFLGDICWIPATS